MLFSKIKKNYQNTSTNSQNNKLQNLNKFCITNHTIGYKFSKSSESLCEFFAENFYENYSEFKFVKARNDVGLSFTLNKSCLLSCAIYGNQLTQIVFNKEHPFYYKLSEAKINYRGLVFDEYYSNILLIGKNISINNPHLLKELIILSNPTAIIYFINFKTNKYNLNMGEIYKTINYYETADFYYSIRSMLIKNNYNISYLKQNINNILGTSINQSLLDFYYTEYFNNFK